MSSGRTLATADDVAPAIGPYSHAAGGGGIVCCSGQLPLDAGGEIVGEDAAAQARQCLENLQRVCRAAGTELRRALRVGVYLVDLDEFAAVNEVYAEFLGDSAPARSTIGVASLPRGARVEIDAIVLA
ncbi:MAG TPA: Rid family detoxifying hydrolase [Conexibacter sp.]|nr:Rid family detoxifying hydrolase [Conexibacter sp.]